MRSADLSCRIPKTGLSNTNRGLERRYEPHAELNMSVRSTQAAAIGAGSGPHMTSSSDNNGDAGYKHGQTDVRDDTITDLELELPLPAGWKSSFASNDQKYFIDKIDRTITWQDPRLGSGEQSIVSIPTQEVVGANART